MTMHDPINTHFCERARERAGIEDAEALFLDLCRALREERHDVIDHVFDIGGRVDAEGKPLRSIWRFAVADGRVFYAVVACAAMRPITLLTHDQIKFYRGVRRAQKKKGKRGPLVCKW